MNFKKIKKNEKIKKIKTKNQTLRFGFCLVESVGLEPTTACL